MQKKYVRNDEQKIEPNILLNDRMASPLSPTYFAACAAAACDRCPRVVVEAHGEYVGRWICWAIHLESLSSYKTRRLSLDALVQETLVKVR
jgi:hypothetical protein